ncbi:MAG: non-hydrolyzing UDP-N-acetylglucosamine 2-epimerase [Solirubrobacteraceae bacterium]
MKILTVVGNRPQFIKAAAISGPLREEHEEVLVHTGQHHDDSLSRVFFSELGLARPDRELGIAGGTNNSQTARMLTALEPLLVQERPDAVLVYGDTNSTLAGALSGAQARVPLVHVEAGMRSFDRSMPEELNRVLTDHASDLLLCPSPAAAENLRRESVAGEAVVVGDVMVDVALRWQPAARERSEVPRSYGVEPGSYLLLTAHRAGNVDDPQRLSALLELIAAVPGPVLFPLHPRTRTRLAEFGYADALQAIPGLTVTEPLGYSEFSALVCQARAVLTDSGGVQKEAYLAGVPCLTLRANTEWVETVQTGWNTLVDLDPGAALAALERRPGPERPALYGDGQAAERSVAAIGELAARSRTTSGAAS